MQPGESWQDFKTRQEHCIETIVETADTDYASALQLLKEHFLLVTGYPLTSEHGLDGWLGTLCKGVAENLY